jgi:hypothetical protein
MQKKSTLISLHAVYVSRSHEPKVLLWVNAWTKLLLCYIGALPDKTIAYAIVWVIEDNFVDEAKGKIYSPIKLFDRAS